MMCMHYAINFLREQLEYDGEPHQRISMRVGSVISPLECCLKNTYFLFKGIYYDHVEGTVMESSISYIVVNQFMENFELNAFSTSAHPQVCGRDMLMILLW